MKKRIFIFGLLLCFILAGCGAGEDSRLEALEAQVDQLQSRVKVLEDLINGTDSEGDSQGIPVFDPLAELTVYEWSFESGTLTVSDAFARIMNVPQGISEAKMVAYRNGTSFFDQTLKMTEGEALDSLEMALEAISIALPTLAEGDVITLKLEVTMPDGTVVSGGDGSWDYSGGQLLLVAG